MKIKHVTLTGADNQSSIEKMLELHNEFTFIEWGILFSSSSMGSPRYPTHDWIKKLCSHNMRLSAHMCGKLVDDAMKFGTIIDEDIKLLVESFTRVQFNLSKGRLKKTLSNPECRIWDFDFSDIIFGGAFSQCMNLLDPILLEQRKISPLFDSSGGRGVLSEWPKIPNHNFGPLWCGYAGGLGPNNIVDELFKIEEAVGDAEIWIDMESKIRNSNNELDFDLCEKVLKAIEPFTK